MNTEEWRVTVTSTKGRTSSVHEEKADAYAKAGAAKRTAGTIVIDIEQWNTGWRKWDFREQITPGGRR